VLRAQAKDRATFPLQPSAAWPAYWLTSLPYHECAGLLVPADHDWRLGPEGGERGGHNEPNRWLIRKAGLRFQTPISD